MNKQCKILIFVDWFEPGFKAGGPIRSVANFVYHLKDIYDIHLITSDRDIGEDKSYEGIPTNKWIDKNGYRILYAAPGYLTFFSLKRWIGEIFPDWIYINSMFSWTFSILPVLVHRIFYKNISVLLAPRGMLKNSALQYKQNKKRIFLKLFKSLYIPRNIIFQATDSTEKKDIDSVFGKREHVKLLPNFPGIQKRFQSVTDKKRGELRLVFVGRVHPIKNLAFLLNILATAKGKIEVTIIGSIEDKLYWKHCQTIIDRFEDRSNVKILENIAHSQLEQLIIDHHVFVLPTQGENYGHAIFESLAAGRPVLISDQTPWRNLTANNAGWDIALTDAGQFKKIIAVLVDMDITQLNVWCEGAWIYCNEYLTSSDLKKNYTDLLEKDNLCRKEF